jgi:hypothetical protein
VVAVLAAGEGNGGSIRWGQQVAAVAEGVC